MKNIHVSDSLTPLQQSNIDEFEVNLKVNLPPSYKSFLLANNGGRPTPNAFPIENFPADQHGMIDWFFSIEEGDVYDLAGNLRLFKGRIPEDLLPIATDPGGNLICLNVNGLNYGKVYYWDHEEEVAEGETPTYANVYLVAESFDDLLQNLIELLD